MQKRYWTAIAVATVIGVLGSVNIGGKELFTSTVVQAAEESGTILQVSMSKESGCYENEFLLNISCGGAAKIYYTMDGSSPITSDTRIEYQEAVFIRDRAGDTNIMSAVEPVLFDSAYATYKDGIMGDWYSAPKDSEVDKATVIKAVGVDATGKYGNVLTNTYFVGKMTEHIQGIEESCKAAGVPLSIMSISVAYDDLFDYNKGIYVKGKVFDEAFSAYKDSIREWEIVDISRKIEANYNQRGSEWERDAHIDYLESDGINTVCRLQQDCGIRIQGNYSRSDLQKGFRLYARNEYGKKKFQYAFFGEDLKNSTGEIIQEFKKLTLRNGGNASFLAKYNDAYWQSLLKDTACETQASRVCIVYLNGEYWGIYVLQEDYDDTYFESRYGVDKNAVVVYKGDAERYESGYTLDEGKLPEGVSDEGYYLNELMQFFAGHSDLKAEEDYKEFEKLVDVESVKDFFAAQIWLNNKWDWPGKNWSMWKTTASDASNVYGDGRWRLCLYDLDFGGWSGSGEAATNTIRDDNYKPYGLLDMDTDNPTVLCFAYLMSNKEFRDSFVDRIKELDSQNFEDTRATEVCKKYRDTYQPLYAQFFSRFFGEDGQWRAESALNGAGSYQALVDFVGKRSKYVQNMIDWVDSFYKNHTIYNSEIAEQSEQKAPKEISICKVTAKKGTKTITVKTVKKSKVTVSVSKKIICSGKKKVNRKVFSKSDNSKGVVKVILSSKLKKGMKVTVTVEKTGYKKKIKNVKVM